MVSIAGPYREGKSYFLNYLADRVAARRDEASVSVDPAGGTGTGAGGAEGVDVRPFRTSSTVNGDAREVSVLMLPGCMNPLPEQPGTALVLLDTPGLLAPSG